MKSYFVSYSWVSEDGCNGDGMINIFYNKKPKYEDFTETRELILSKLIERGIAISIDGIVILNIVKLRGK